MRSATAMRSMCDSTAKIVCGTPNPRKAPLGGVWVCTTRQSMRACCQRYAPAACRTPREATTGESVT